MKIYATREHTYMISDFYLKNVDDINRSIPEVPIHPNLLIPYSATIENKCLYLHYTVCVSGMTLRDFIQHVNSSKVNVICDALHQVKPIAIMLELIRIYEFMLYNNMLIGQSNINPDNIWIEREQNGHLKIFVLYTLESHVQCQFRTNTCKEYLPSEIINEHMNILYNESKLTRIDTRVTSINIVYSLGLVLYFIVRGRDAFDRYRINPFEKPLMGHDMNALMSKLIISATDTDYKHRPSLSEWKKQMIDRTNVTCIML